MNHLLMNRNLNLTKTDEVVIFRSACIGDFLVILPFINYLLNTIGISEDKISIVIINREKLNPVNLFFNKQSLLALNSQVVSPDDFFSSAREVRKKINRGKNTKIIYLPFYSETLFSYIKKIAAIKYICGFTSSIFGLDLQNLKKKKVQSQYLTYFEKLGISDATKYLNFDIFRLLNFLPEEISKVQTFMPESSVVKVALYLNSKLPMKIWATKEFFTAIEYLKKAYNADIYLIGGEEDYEYNQHVISCFKLENVINIAGKFSLRETFIFFNQLNLLVSNDGAPIHIAAYTKCPILGIYTFKEELGTWEPYVSNNYIVHRKNVSCKHCHLENCNMPICIQGIRFEHIKNSLEILLSNQNIRRSVVDF